MHAVFILNGLSHWICQRLHNKTLNALSFVQVKKKKKKKMASDSLLDRGSRGKTIVIME